MALHRAFVIRPVEPWRYLVRRRSYDSLAFADKPELSDKWPTVHVKEQKTILHPRVADLHLDPLGPPRFRRSARGR
jgi:hypothetical protein